MEFKKANFEGDYSNFLNCVPAIGEKRKFWGSQAMHNKRRNTIAKLKKERKLCLSHTHSTLSPVSLKLHALAWRNISTLKKQEYERDLKSFLESPTGHYRAEEINWIRKTYRIIKQSLTTSNLLLSSSDDWNYANFSHEASKRKSLC